MLTLQCYPENNLFTLKGTNTYWRFGAVACEGHRFFWVWSLDGCKLFSVVLGYDLDGAAWVVALLNDLYLYGYAFLQFFYVADDADTTPIDGMERAQGADGILQRFAAECAKALVDE